MARRGAAGAAGALATALATTLAAAVATALAAAAGAQAQVAPYVMFTVAGGGGSGGDGGPATAAALGGPWGVAVNGTTGVVFIADAAAARVRAVATAAAPAVITTVAGTGVAGYGGDGGAATAAQLNAPAAVAVGAGGVLYIADRANHVIRRVAAGGTITTVAGTPATPGFSGDGGAATAAKLNSPAAVAVDPATGGVYIADDANARVRLVSAAGVIVTVAGVGTAGTGPTNDGIPAVTAEVGSPRGVAVSPVGPTLFIADAYHARIRYVTGVTIQTATGNGTAAYGGDGGGATAAAAAVAGVSGVAVDAATGDLYFADTGNARVRVLRRATGVLELVAGNGTAASGGDGGRANATGLAAPRGVAPDANGTVVFIADAAGSRVRAAVRPVAVAAVTPAVVAVEPAGGGRVDLLLTGAAFDSRLGDVSGAAVGAWACGALVRVNATAVRCMAWPAAAACGAVAAVTPLPLTLTWRMFTFAAAAGSATLTVVPPPAVVNVAPTAVTAGGVLAVTGVRFQPSGGNASALPTVTVGGVPCTSVTVVTPDAAVTCVVPALPPATPGYPYATVVVTNTAGVATPPGFTVVYGAPAYYITTVGGNGAASSFGDGGPATGSGIAGPLAVAAVAGGWLVTENGGGRARRVFDNGTITTVATGLAAATGVAVDAAAGTVVVADTNNHHVARFALAGGGGGNGTTVLAGSVSWGVGGDGGPATAASLNTPCGVDFNASGAVFVADTGNNRVRLVVPGGNISLYAGSAALGGDTGDGGPATLAALDAPAGVAVDRATGRLYIAESGGNRVRLVTAGGKVATVAGNGAAAYDGDGGPATLASLSYPAAVALLAGSSTDFVIADQNNHCVRLVVGGTITTLAGVAATGGFAGDGGLASAALLNMPTSVAVTAAGFLIADKVNNRVRGVFPPPSLLYLTPSVVSAAQGAGATVNITLTGSMLDNRTAEIVAVKVGRHACGAVTAAAPWQVVCHAWPVSAAVATLAGASAVMPLTVTWRGITTNASGVTLAVVAPATVTAVSPPAAAAGSVITVSGVGFAPLGAALLPTVTVGGAPCTVVTTVAADTNVSCVLPPLLATTPGYPNVTVAVTNYGGVPSTTNGTVRYPAVPTIVAVTPSTLATSSSSSAAAAALLLTCAAVDGSACAAGFTAVTVGTTPCGAVTAANATTVVCDAWPAAAAASAAGRSAILSVSFVWRGAAGNASAGATLALQTPPVITAVVPSRGVAGDAMALFGYDLQPWGTAAPPAVTVGGAPCTNVTVMVRDASVVCRLPDVPPASAGYPLLPVVVVNPAGQPSDPPAAVVEYPTLVAAYLTAPPAVAVWPAVTPLTPPPAVQATGKGVLTCTLYVAAVDAAGGSDGAGAGLTPLLAGATSVAGTPPATTTPAALAWNATTLRAAAGAAVNVSAVCRDSLGQSATAAASFVVTTPAVALSWLAPLPAAAGGVVALRPLPLPPAVAALNASAPLPDVPLPVGAWTCAAALATAAAPTAPLSTCSGVAPVAAGAPAGSATVTFAGLTAVDAALGAAMSLTAQCVYGATGEVHALPPAPAAVVTVAVALTPPALVASAYEPSPAWAAVVTASDGAPLADANATCAWQVVAASSPLAQLAGATAAARYAVAADGVVAAAPLVVEAPPAATLSLRLTCVVWGKPVAAPDTLAVTVAPYVVTAATAPPAAVPSSDALGATLLPLAAPAPDVATHGVGSVACTLAVAGGAVCPPSAPSYGVAFAVPPLTTVALVGDVSVTATLPAGATAHRVTFASVGVYGGARCAANVSVTCRDAAGRSASSLAPTTPAAAAAAVAAAVGLSGTPGPTFAVTVAALTAAWAAGTPAAVACAPAPLPRLTLHLAMSDGAALPPAVEVLCVAALLPASVATPWATPLSSLASQALSSCSGVAAAAAWSIDCLTAAAAAWGAAAAVVAECVWPATGERVRLPPLPVAVAAARVTLASPTGAVPAVALGYLPLRLTATLLLPPGAVPAAVAAAGVAECGVALVNATVRGVSVASDAWRVAADADASAAAVSVNVTLAAPPGVRAFLRAECSLWGTPLASAPLAVVTATLAVAPAAAVPAYFIASDAAAPWPVTPPLVLRVSAVEDGTAVTDVTCALSSPTPAVTLHAVAAGASLLAVAPDDATGAVTVPAFAIQAPFDAAAVALTATCRRPASGDVAPAWSFTVPAVRLAVARCVPPAATSPMEQALPPFSVAVTAQVPGAPGADDPCATPPAVAGVPLPPVVCTVTPNASAAASNDTTFLRGTVAQVDAARHVAVWAGFTLTAPQGRTYSMSVACAVGALPLPGAFGFDLTLAGCLPGRASVSIACVLCSGGTFSVGGVGATCIGCPPRGATCVDGILTLAPNYYRPPRQNGAPIGPDTELHPCYNAEACTLNASSASTATYGCAPGYTGALCGVCDAAAGYARFGEACRTCWDPAASALFVAVAVLVLFILLTRVALRTATGRSDASIVLRITLSYLQAVGSLRVFRAGSTSAYQNVMGWTDAVSASPLSVGALQCVARLPYLVQYVLTVALPALAAVAVVAIFLAATVARAVRCRPAPSFAARDARDAVARWWQSRRHLSTLLFVLFIAYMPITGASLRVLDCMPTVDGVRYLRSDLSVECYTGQHAAARALAYVVLVVVGLGFPAGLAWLLGTASQGQLLDDAFHSTWGFLFDGYRAPSLQMVANGSGGGGGTGKADASCAPAPAAIPVLAARKARPLSGAATPREPRRTSLLPARLSQTWRIEGDSRVWWEGIVLARKAGVVLLAVLVSNPYLQCVGASLWFLAALLLQLRYAPYSRPLFNRLETASLGASLLTAIVSTALLQYNVGVSTADAHAPASMTPIEWAVTVVLALINMGTFVALAGVWLRLQCARAHGLLQAGVTSVRGLRTPTTGSRGAAFAARGRDDDDGTPAPTTLTANPLRAAAPRVTVHLELPPAAAADPTVAAADPPVAAADPTVAAAADVMPALRPTAAAAVAAAAAPSAMGFAAVVVGRGAARRTAQAPVMTTGSVPSA